MTTIAILPIKNFDDAKQRLAEGLSPGARRALAEAMFSDVLVALRRAASIDRTIVVTADVGAAQIAGGYGALALGDDDRGHNPAARSGVQYALAEGVDRVLLVPGDCPMIDPAEIDQLLAEERGEPSAAIIPDRHGTGTNALLLCPPDSLEPAFGPGSCQRHLAAAGSAGALVEVPSLGLDVDTPEDLDALQEAITASRGGAAHTRGMLRQLLRSAS